MIATDAGRDIEAIAAMGRGDHEARAAFLARHGALLQSICRTVAPNYRFAEAAYNDLLQSPDFAAEFEDYRGQSSFAAFATKVLIDGFLFRRLLVTIRRDRVAGMDAFEAFFRRRLTRLVAEGIKERQLHQDAHNWVLEQILKDDRNQLEIWAMQADSIGFIVTKLALLVADFRRSSDAPSELRRRDLPAAIARLPPFDRAVFVQCYRYHAASAREVMYGLISFHPGITEQSVWEARRRVDAALGPIAAAISVSVVSWEAIVEGHRRSVSGPPGSDPAAETDAVAEEDWAAFRAAVFHAMIVVRLSLRERQYFELFFEGMRPREIAKAMAAPVTTIYQLSRNGLGKLRTELLHSPIAKNLIASVTGNDAYLEPDLPTRGVRQPRGTQKGPLS